MAEISPTNNAAAPAGAASPEIGWARCTAEMLYDLIAGMNRRKSNGMLEIQAAGTLKKLFFNAGEFVFGSSDNMDDRLGEVIYRDAMINLDQLTRFAVQVDRKNKFGQVLLRSGSFTNIDLWSALKSQMTEIFRSVFFVEDSLVKVKTGRPPVEVSFEQGTADLLDASFSFGLQFRSFKSRANGNVKIIVEPNGPSSEVPKGTFVADLMDICEDSPTVDVLLNRSKLSHQNTLVAVHRLIANGILRADGLPDVHIDNVEGHFAGIKSSIDTYRVLFPIVVSAFAAAKMELPVKDLSQFALSLNHDGAASIFLSSNGDLASESIAGILRQCAGNLHRMEYFQRRVVTLTRFLFQMASDLLPYEQSQAFKRDFQEIAH